jgi:hypothetical protein
MKWKAHVVAVANDIPTSRSGSGHASAEYVKGTGPSPGLEKTMTRSITVAMQTMKENPVKMRQMPRRGTW